MDPDAPRLTPHPVAADAVCPATGARATGRVEELNARETRIVFGPGTELDGFDVGATVELTFVSSVLGGTRSLRGRVISARADALKVRFESVASTPANSFFGRRHSLRLRPEVLPIGRTAELAWATHDQVPATIDDISMNGAALIVRRKNGYPLEGTKVRVRLAGPSGVTVWMSGTVRHVGSIDLEVRLGIQFDLRIADVEGAGPALRELVRQIERLQVDELVLAFAGISPDFPG